MAHKPGTTRFVSDDSFLDRVTTRMTDSDEPNGTHGSRAKIPKTEPKQNQRNKHGTQELRPPTSKTPMTQETPNRPKTEPKQNQRNKSGTQGLLPPRLKRPRRPPRDPQDPKYVSPVRCGVVLCGVEWRGRKIELKNVDVHALFGADSFRTIDY